MRIFVLLISIFLCSVIFAEIYKTVDKYGNVSYSDIPSANAQQIELSPVTTVSPPTATNATTSSAVVVVNKSVRKPYTSFVMLSPKDQETIQNQPTITVQTQTDPSLQKGDKIGLLLDGKMQGTPQEGTQFTLVHIDRGAHQLRAVLVDNTGAVIKETPTITIFVHYASVNF